MSLPTVTINVQYDRQKEVLREFLRDFEVENEDGGEEMAVERERKYARLLQRVADREEDAVVIDLNDLFKFESKRKQSSGTLVCDSIMENTAHYLELASEAIDAEMPDPSPGHNFTYEDEVLDVILHHRMQRNLTIREEHAAESSQQFPSSESAGTQSAPPLSNMDPTEQAAQLEMFPPELLRRYTVYFKPLLPEIRHPSEPVKPNLAVREVKSSHLGKLITIRGVATRVSEVKPAVLVTAYTCDTCGHEVFQEVKSRQYMPLVECPSRECVANRLKGQLFPSTRASKFQAFQEVRLQELADQVPVGHIPRSLTLHLCGPLVRSVLPGDSVDISGIFMPKPYTGFRAMKAGLLTDTYLNVQYVHSLKQQYDKQLAEIEQNPALEAEIEELRRGGNVYERLASSIAPEIFGHLDVKKALLLQLIGGVTKEVGDGMKIRGNINMCLMGDPGVAKSQLLKFIVRVAPRGVYTTGRGSSGVGLTAAVLRDPVTDEVVLEGGALVLADHGICCIDEFDKMDDSDRTAIHEVMEQQTISIAKAGMSTTLNARTSILAAANPVYGRWNPRLSPVENINLPAALLSRFDLLFLMLDKHTAESDRMLARHVAYVHLHNQAPATENAVRPELIQHYIAMARTYRPVISPELADVLASAYVQMRQRHKREIEQGKQFGYTTPRALLGIMRMAQALARLRFSNTVVQEDVDEALRLSVVSKQSLQTDVAPQRSDAAASIYQIIVDLFRAAQTPSIQMSEVRSRVTGKGFDLDELDHTLRQYVDMGLLLVTAEDTLEKM